MKQRFDLRIYKNNLRSRYKAIRKAMKPEIKAEKDKMILSHVTGMNDYQAADTLLCYVSTPEETDTRLLIETAFSHGKRVAVPYCIDGTRLMDFYLINSLNELVPRTYGVLEPMADPEKKLESFERSLCILPGLVFDKYGRRIGYGGGYYDRFLSQRYKGATVGICYYSCTVSRIKHGRYDVPADYVVTENGCARAARWEKRPEKQ